MTDSTLRPLLEARNLSRRFGEQQAVFPLDLTLQAGELVGLLGPNGAGKTTTLYMLVGLLAPTSGTVRISGHDLTTEPVEAKRHLGFLADQPLLYQQLTGREFLQFSAGLWGVEADEALRRAEPWLEDFSLSGALDKLSGSYSHGMKQKLALTAQLIHQPRVLVADEPTVGLDPRSGMAMQKAFRWLCDQGSTVLLSTHLLAMAEQLCDRLVIMDRGIVQAEGPTREFLADRAESLESLFLELTGER